MVQVLRLVLDLHARFHRSMQVPHSPAWSQRGNPPGHTRLTDRVYSRRWLCSCSFWSHFEGTEGYKTASQLPHHFVHSARWCHAFAHYPLCQYLWTSAGVYRTSIWFSAIMYRACCAHCKNRFSPSLPSRPTSDRGTQRHMLRRLSRECSWVWELVLRWPSVELR